MDEISLKEYKSKVRKLNSKRNFKVTNSYGVADGFAYYRKIKPKDKKFVLTNSQYYSIIREINNLLAEGLLQGKEVVFPYKLGKLEIRKYESILRFKEGKLKTNLPIDWEKTLQLWFEDEDSAKDKTLVRFEEKEIFKIYYNRKNANYKNKAFYEFIVNRSIKRGLKVPIQEGNIEAFLLKKPTLI